jgi:hypothetical protein
LAVADLPRVARSSPPGFVQTSEGKSVEHLPASAFYRRGQEESLGEGVRMRTAAKVLGLVGGLLGIIAGILAMAVGGGAVLGVTNGGAVALGFAAVIVAVAGIVGGALAGRPTASWILMTFAGVVGFVCVRALWALPGVMLIVGAVFEFKTRHQTRIAVGSGPYAQAMSPSEPPGPGYPTQAVLPPVAPPAAPPSPTTDALVKLAELRQKDLLSAEEYDRQKAKLLEQP